MFFKFNFPQSADDIEKFKSDVLRCKIAFRQPNWDVSSVTSHVVYGDKDKIDEYIKDIDIMISTMDNYRVKKKYFFKKFFKNF